MDRGYVMILVGKDHHLADQRGYAAEHRLVAERKLGRRLRPGELVHHKDENRQNNHPDNLEVMASIAEHKVAHRRPGVIRRLPGEANLMIACSCGCGATFLQYDQAGLPRKFLPGHNPQPRPTCEAVLGALRVAPNQTLRWIELKNALGLTKAALDSAIIKLKGKGEIHNPAWGRWRLIEGMAP